MTEQQIKQAIGLAEEAIRQPMSEWFGKTKECLEQILAILKADQEPCGTCGGRKELWDTGEATPCPYCQRRCRKCDKMFDCTDRAVKVWCPDCQPKSQEPMCPTCKDTKEVWDMQEFGGRETGDKVPCPKCQVPANVWQIHLETKTKEKFYTKLRALIPEDLFERTKTKMSQEPAEKQHKEDCPPRYDNLREAGIECTCKLTEKPVSELKALIRTLKIYSETKHPVSQGFYQGLCMRAIDALEAQGEHIKLLNDCDDSSTRVIGEMDEEIKDLQVQLEAETKANEILTKAKKNISDENEELRAQLKDTIELYNKWHAKVEPLEAQLKEQAEEIERQKPYMRCLSSCATSQQDNVYGKTKCNCGCEQALKGDK